MGVVLVVVVIAVVVAVANAAAVAAAVDCSCDDAGQAHIDSDPLCESDGHGAGSSNCCCNTVTFRCHLHRDRCLWELRYRAIQGC